MAWYAVPKHSVSFAACIRITLTSGTVVARRSMLRVELAVQASDILGECPVWSAAQGLFCHDLAEPRLHNFNPASGSRTARALSHAAPLGGLAATSDPHRRVLGHPGGVVLLDLDTGQEEGPCGQSGTELQRRPSGSCRAIVVSDRRAHGDPATRDADSIDG
jgi:hypothetical protein